MNSVHESIARRRAAALRTDEPGLAVEPEQFSCVVLGSRPGLLLAPWQAESWVFPWSHLLWARLASSDAHDELTLSFPHHQAIVFGEDLGGLLDAVAEFRIAMMRNVPAQYRRQIGKDRAFVSKIDVRRVERDDANLIGKKSE